MTVVTNSGPLIALAKLNRLDLLPSLYGEVIIPQAVYHKAVVDVWYLQEIGRNLWLRNIK